MQYTYLYYLDNKCKTAHKECAHITNSMEVCMQHAVHTHWSAYHYNALYFFNAAALSKDEQNFPFIAVLWQNRKVNF